MMNPIFSKNKLKILFLPLLFIVVECFGVPKLQLQRSSISSISELWNLQIISDFKSSKIVTVKISAYNSSNILMYDASIDNFILQTGISNFNSNQRSLIRVKYSNEQMLDMLVNSELTVVISMFEPGSYTELTQTRQVIRLNIIQSQQPSDTTSSSNKFKKHIDLGGTIEMTGLYNTRQDTLFYMPFDYFRLQTHHRVKIEGLPFIYDMYVTTEQKHTNQRLNSYSFKFDYETFKQQLITKFSQKVDNIEQFGVVNELLNEDYRLTKASILDSLKSNKLIKEEYIEKYKEYIAIDSLKNYLQIYDEVNLKKAISELDRYRRDTIDKFVSNLSNGKSGTYWDSIRGNGIEEEIHTYDSMVLLLQDKHNEILAKSDSIVGRVDTAKFLYDSISHSVQKKYDQLLKEYDNNKDSLDNFLKKISNYNVQDLLSFSKLNNLINDKIASYEKYYNKKELEKLKKLKEGDVSQLEAQLNSVSDKYKILERKELMLNSLKRFELGTVYPYYSNYTVNGIVLNGYDINYTYKNIYTSFSGGKQLNIINDSIQNFIELTKPMLYAFALGYGDKLSNHLHLNYSYGSRIFHNKLLDLDLKSVNHVIAPDFRYSFFKDKWMISGEFPVSFISKELLDNNTESRTGFANEMILNGVITKSTSVEVSNQYISDYFYSFGVPFLYSNYLHFNQKVRQKLKDNITAELGYSYEKFYKSEKIGRVPTDIHTIQSAMNFGYKKWNINMTYAPVWFEVKDRTNTRNFMHTSGLTVSTNFIINQDKKLISTVGFNYNSFYNAQTFISDFGSIVIENNVLQINKSMNYYLIERLSFKDNYTIGFNFSLQKNNFIDTSNINLLILGINYTQDINNSINYTISYQAMQHQKSSLRHNVQTQLNCNINTYLSIGAVMYYDYLNGVVEGRSYNKTNAFQVMTNLIFKI
jgi:hypothetical protein